MMEDELFKRLVESMGQMNEIARGERAPSREFVINAVHVKKIRGITGLSQPKFARLIDVQVATLRNWEQGRREPTGPAKALLRAIGNNPSGVLQALVENSPRNEHAEVGAIARSTRVPASRSAGRNRRSPR